MQRIAQGIFRLEAAGFVNAYLIEGGADLTLVDTGHSRAASALLAEIKGNGFDLKDIGRVVLTHAHADHVGGIAALLDHHHVRVYAHPREIPVLQGKAPMPRFRGMKGFLLREAHQRLLPWTPLKGVLPVEPGTPLRGIPQWQVLHTPGHTEGSLSLFHPVRQILICGDALSNRGGILHVPPDYLNQDAKALRRSLDSLARLDSDVLCCGHGPVVRGGAFRHIDAAIQR